MPRFAPFYPAFLIFLGAVLVACGGFWASWRQTNFDAQIREKNEELVRLQTAQSELITGGDSFCYLLLIDIGGDTRQLIFTNHGSKFPLYDVEAQIVDLDGPPLTATELWKRAPQNTVSLGNMAPEFGRRTTTINLSGRKKYDLNIFYTARNGFWIQLLRMRRTEKGWVSATKVNLEKQGVEGQELYRAVDEGFPRKLDGRVDWGGSGHWQRLRE